MTSVAPTQPIPAPIPRPTPNQPPPPCPIPFQHTPRLQPPRLLRPRPSDPNRRPILNLADPIPYPNPFRSRKSRSDSFPPLSKDPIERDPYPALPILLDRLEHLQGSLMSRFVARSMSLFEILVRPSRYRREDFSSLGIVREGEDDVVSARFDVKGMARDGFLLFVHKTGLERRRADRWSSSGRFHHFR
jgi:hypothetical protein